MGDLRISPLRWTKNCGHEFRWTKLRLPCYTQAHMKIINLIEASALEQLKKRGRSTYTEEYNRG